MRNKAQICKQFVKNDQTQLKSPKKKKERKTHTHIVTITNHSS